MNKPKPKIDINSLRIEVVEDDLYSDFNYRTYQTLQYFLRDNNRFLKVGSFEEINKFLSDKFKINLSIILFNYPGTYYLKNILTKHFLEYTGTMNNGRDLLGI